MWLGVKDCACLLMPIDPEPFLADLNGIDLSKSEKVELIHILASFAESFVDRAFDAHGKRSESDIAAATDSNMRRKSVDSAHALLQPTFKLNAATRQKVTCHEGDR